MRLVLFFMMFAALPAQATDRLSTLTALTTPQKDDYGTPCIGKPLPETNKVANSAANLVEYAVRYVNSCNFDIYLRVCFKGTKNCREGIIPRKAKKSIVLGYDSGGRGFSYETFELPAPY